MFLENDSPACFAGRRKLSFFNVLTHERTDGDEGEGKYTGWSSETDWLGTCDPERIPGETDMILPSHTEVITTAFPFSQARLQRSSWFTHTPSSLLLPPTKGRGWGNKVTGPCPDGLCQSPLSVDLNPWKLGSVLGGRATGWFSNLFTTLILASCFSMSSYGVQDRSCCSL